MDKSYNRNVVNYLTSLTFSGSNKIRIVLSKNSGITPNENGIDIQLIDDILPQNQYFQWMQSCDLVLLAYDPLSYKRRTSGVFVETVCSGKIPVVTHGTWMSSELKKFDLSDLSVDWNDPNILNTIEYCATEPKIRSKLNKMKNVYVSFHNEENFSKSLRNLADPKVG
ncbi:hypothetical protein ACFL7M_02980 [Thermodesulfobacteriota bacterium]